MTPVQRAAAIHVIDELEAGRTVNNLPPELASMFRPSVQPYLISEVRYDPAAEIAKLRMPILIMQGDRDLQTTEADAHRLAEAAPKADLVLLQGVNHVLRDAPADRTGNLALYFQPDVPLAAAVLPTLTAFFRAAPPSPR
jgi:pimeloyl-ACP methyl ester carboxylesterase